MGMQTHANGRRVTRIVAALGVLGGAVTAGAAVAPAASADPATPNRVDLVSASSLGPETQAGYQISAEPGDAIQLVFYVTGTCTPQAGKVNCDPPNGNGEGVAGDNGAPLANATLNVSVDHGFFTPNCVSGGITEYAACSFTSPPSAGSIVGNLVSSGTTQTVTTDALGEFVVTLGIGRDTAFDQLGQLNAHVSVAGLAPEVPGDRSVGTSCPGSTSVVPTVGATTPPGGTGGCPVLVQWTTSEKPLNGGTAKLIAVPSISSPPGTVIPTENNVLASDSGTTDVPDVARVDFLVHMTDQFGNLVSYALGGGLPTLTKTGPGSLYRCTGSSATSVCTAGTALAAGASAAGSYLDPDLQIVYQADTNDASINLRYPCHIGESSCSAAHTATPGANDGTQTDVLAWSAPTTFFQSYVAGSPPAATYIAGTATSATDTFTLNFYEQLGVMSLNAPAAFVSQPETVTATVTHWDGTPVANKVVRFMVQGADAVVGSNVSNSTGVATLTYTPANSGSDNVQAYTDFDNDLARDLGEPDASTDVTVSTASIPGAPTGVIASSSAGQATVSWVAPANNGGSSISGYDVQFSSNGSATWTSASSAFHSSTATSHTVTGLSDGTVYIFRVAAINAIGTGPYSSPSSPVTPGLVPGAPTGVTVTGGNAQATVAWTPPASNGGSAIVGYDVQYSSDGGSTWISGPNAFHTNTATSQTATGLTNGTPYMFRIAAINSIGAGAYSAPSTAVTPGVTPAAPTGLTAMAGHGSATLSWTAPSAAGTSAITGYNVQESTSGGASWSTAATRRGSAVGHDSPATTRTISGLVNGTSYVFRVAAINATGTGGYSAPSTPVTPTAGGSDLTIGVPGDIDAGQRINVTTTLTDSASHGPIEGTPVDLYKRHGGSPWTLVARVTTDDAGMAHYRLEPTRNTRYEWRYAGDGSHDPATSDSRSVIVHQVVTARITKHSSKAGSVVEIFGSVTPNESGRAVVLQRRDHGSWVSTHASATIHSQPLPNGQIERGYIVAVPTGHAGHFIYRIHRAATSENAAGNSSSVHLHVT